MPDKAIRLLIQFALIALAAVVAGMTVAWLLIWFVALTAGLSPEPRLVAFFMMIGGAVSGFVTAGVLVESSGAA